MPTRCSRLSRTVSVLRVSLCKWLLRRSFLRSSNSSKISFDLLIKTSSDYWAKFAEAREVLGKMLADGKLKTEVTVVEGGIPAAPAALRELYNGSNTGKLVVKCL